MRIREPRPIPFDVYDYLIIAAGVASVVLGGWGVIHLFMAL